MKETPGDCPHPTLTRDYGRREEVSAQCRRYSRYTVQEKCKRTKPLKIPGAQVRGTRGEGVPMHRKTPPLPYIGREGFGLQF